MIDGNDEINLLIEIADSYITQELQIDIKLGNLCEIPKRKNKYKIRNISNKEEIKKTKIQ